MAEESSFGKQKKGRSFRGLAIVILFIAILIPVTVIAVMYVIELRSEAGPTEEPKNVEITNILDTTATVSWITPSAKTAGYIKYGTTSSIENVAFDIRDVTESTGSYETHYVDLRELNPGTVYYYVIVVGGKEYKNGDELFRFKTGPLLDVIDTPKPVKGSVSDPSGDDEELIVHMYVKNGDKISNKISTLTTGLNYTLDLANLRTSNLANLYTDFEGATLYVFAQGGGRGEGSITTEIIIAEE